ncbi:hypothetical protein BTR23_07390 [Alkalihalophilus pseudofirmus]|nr:hypothetical protein BTR23_07390 [Alkalihalophilus pseudofirmus]
MNNIIINGVPLAIQNWEENLNDNKREFTFSFYTNGEKELNLIKNLFGNKILEVRLDSGEEIKVRVPSWSYSLKDDDYSEVPFNITLRETDENEVESDYQARVAVYSLESLLRLDALKETLIKKGIISEEELSSKYNDVMERDHQKRMNYLLTGDEGKSI